MAQPTDAPSLLEYGIEQHYPVQLLLASQWGSGSIESCVYRSGPSRAWCVKPPAAEDVLGVVLKGESTLTRRVGRKMEQQALANGMVVLIPAHAESALRWTGTDEWFHFFINPSFKARIAMEAFDRDPARVEMGYNFLFSDGLIAQIGYNLLIEMKKRGALGHMYVDTLAQTLVMHMFQRYATAPGYKNWPEPRGQLPPRTLRRIHDYVQAHLAQNPHLEEIASTVNLSASYLTQAYKRTTGQSLHQFVMEQRLAEAHRLILTSTLSLTQIALQTGFTDQSHLTHCFKDRLGITPGDLFKHRKNLQNQHKNLQDD